MNNEGKAVKQVRSANARSGSFFRLCTLAICILVLLCAFLMPGSRVQDGGDPVAVSHRIKVRNAELYVEIHGPHEAPLLLWLHGGPGGPERPLFRYFNSDLEHHFLVAYLDQRGAGRSFDRTADPARLTVAQHLEDLETVISYLRRTYTKEKIYLVGHSWGTVLGLLHAKAHPKTVATLISVAPVVSFSEQQRRAYAFDLAETKRRGETSTLEELRRLGEPPYEMIEKANALERITSHYGGVDFEPRNRAAIVLHGVLLGLATPWEIPGFIEGLHLTQRAMHAELLQLDLRNEVKAIEIPLFFFLGRHDRHVDAELAASYFETLQAPKKVLHWFERSAHNLPFDEPQLFNERVGQAIQSIEGHLGQ
jgi:pimeloyl-ACP methyl ester carboxylesterase